MGIVGTAILRREVANVTNAYASPYFNAEIDTVLGYHTDSLLVVPLVGSDGRILGGLELLNKLSGFFNADDEQLASRTAERLSRWIERDDFYPAAVEAEAISLRNEIGCDRVTVFKLDHRTSRLVSLHADGDSGRTISLNMKLGIAGLSAVTGSSLNIEAAWDDPRFDRSIDQRTGFRTRTLLCVPLIASSGETIGVIEAINRKEGVFSLEDLELLQAVGGSLAVAIENSILLGEQERQFRSMLNALMAAVDGRDPMTASHSATVADHAVGIGVALGLSESECDMLHVAGVLCDFGMVGVDSALLSKEGTLTSEEYEQIKRHVELSGDILKHIRFTRKYRKLPLIVTAHHEHVDGSGYPSGLRGREIPFMAKILSVADVFDALTSERHHRGRMSWDDALLIIDAGVGKRFDASVVDGLKSYLATINALHDAVSDSGSIGNGAE